MKLIELNDAQREAAEHIYGPLLVLAGPGTGKTQLLSARIANILTLTDASPSNILCLTFTENAASNMRERLSGIIGAGAYDVHIATYHSFGSDIIRSYPEYFEDIDLDTGADTRLERPIDDLQRIQILSEIVAKLPYTSPLIGAKHYIKNVSSTISELKRGIYTPDSLHTLASQNIAQAESLGPKIASMLEGIARFPSKAEQSIELFGPIFALLDGLPGLAELAHDTLGEAMSESSSTNKSTPLTTWKNNWLPKDSSGRHAFTDILQHKKSLELANIYRQYQAELEARQLYDFDDMILSTITALKSRDELRFNLQEKYQFILLDEFQDTNAAQFELVRLLADNPANEGQPNIFAVGDDDQAIYAFQGARVSNMLAFTNSFRSVKVVNLVENYRSHRDIIHTARGVAEQIESRLHHHIDGVDKVLIASALELPELASIERREFGGAANEYSWVASKIYELIKSGTSPSQIAVLAPQHKYLEAVVPFVASLNLPIAYEKRENILDAPLIRSLKMMTDLVLACEQGDIVQMNVLLPQVLSLEFYQLPVVDIWRINWELKRGQDLSWAELALDNESLAPHVVAFLSMGLRVGHEPLEYMLDYLTGNTGLDLGDGSIYTCPLRNFYFGDATTDPLLYFDTLANLSTIREHLRAWQSGQDTMLTLEDLTKFFDAYKAAEQPLINSHPVALADNAVQLMSVYKAKGLEFEHVFLLSVHDDVWGKSARGGGNKLSLPANLEYIRYQGSSEDELRRLLFVAITRAKHGLYLTSHTHRDNGKPTEPVKYLLELTDGDTRSSTVLPAHHQKVQVTTFSQADTMQAIDTMWHSRHLQLDASLKSLLGNRLENYQMSPTHLNTFIDLQYGGPEAFLLKTLLKFPNAPGPDGEYGNAVHWALEQHQRRIEQGRPASVKQVLLDFDKNLAKRYIPTERMQDYQNRGHEALTKYLEAREEMFKLPAKTEVDFRKEGVLLGEAHLTGKIDRLEVDKAGKTVHIVDFKTGQPHTKWDKEVKMLKYKQQLYFYKFLIEGSHTWQNYKVATARLEFVEPDENGNIVPGLEIKFDEKEEQEMKQLIGAVWGTIKNLDLPDVTSFEENYAGIQNFISYLIDLN
jgi:DNA helicase II / ATP-dependent DNA helicase PcrA